MQIGAAGGAGIAYRSFEPRQSAPAQGGGVSVGQGSNDAKTTQLDFSRMRPSEQIDVVNRLIRSGQMSLDESSSLLVIIPPGKALADIDSEPVDLFAQLRQRYDYNIATGNDRAAEYNMKALAALERLQGSIVGADFSV